MNFPGVIKKPIITEKSMQEAIANRYTFEVVIQATKGQIKEDIQQLFGVEVVKVRTAKIAGDRKRVGRLRREIKKSDGKKAIVELKKGQKIDIFETQK